MQDTGSLTGAGPVRTSISSEIKSFAERLADRAQHLAEKVNGKLEPVMTSAPPTEGSPPSEKDICKPPQEYPPLFASLRDNFLNIEHSLNSIESALSRTEL